MSSHGAELQSLKNISTGQQYMWSADPSFWGKHSPVLFPIVGALKENTYYYQGKEYRLPRHGFARDMEFSLNKQSDNFLSFLLESNDSTLQVFPFQFQLFLDYELLGNSLEVTYRIINTGKGAMYFSIGGHPAFKVPLFEGEAYEDYILKFGKTETSGRWLLHNGLLAAGTSPFLDNTDTVVLNKSLFDSDAVVLKHLNSSEVKLISAKTGKGFAFDFSGFPYLGIWAAPNADFVCIEPWCGIADSVQSNQQLNDKEGINKLDAGVQFARKWKFSIL